MQEVVGFNLAIESLNEMEILEAKKTQLAEEVGGLRVAHGDLEKL
jgi:hypothetical protein